VVYGEGRVHEDEGVGDAELRVLCSCCIIKEIQKRWTYIEVLSHLKTDKEREIGFKVYREWTGLLLGIRFWLMLRRGNRWWRGFRFSSILGYPLWFKERRNIKNNETSISSSYPSIIIIKMKRMDKEPTLKIWRGQAVFLWGVHWLCYAVCACSAININQKIRKKMKKSKIRWKNINENQDIWEDPYAAHSRLYESEEKENEIWKWEATAEPTRRIKRNDEKRISDGDVAVSLLLAVALLNNGYFTIEIWKIKNIKVNFHPFS